jgi:lysophospholipase L1-like esterase
MFQRGFFFKENRNDMKKSFIFVSEDELYTKEKGYGFVNAEMLEGAEPMNIPGINSGFIPKDIEDVLPVPTMFKADVNHQGNFKVIIEAENDGSDAQIFFERRRMYYVGNFTGVAKFSFSVNVCDIIPEWKERIYKDTDLDITWVGEGFRVHSIEIKEINCPTLFLAGDSTVTDQPSDFPYSPGATYCGWGQMLPAFLNDACAVSNHAHSGLTTETFRKEGHYSIVTQYIKSGDYFFIQFGHNDQKHEELREDTGYRANIVRYITEVRSQNAIPVLVTPLARNTWKDGEYLDYLEKYAGECVKISEEYDVPLLDLHALSMELIKKTGMEESTKYFHPGDYTHTNDYGAYLMASYVAGEISRLSESSKNAAVKQLAGFLKKDVGAWEIDKDKLKMPKIRGCEATPIEPYSIAMDRLDEILRRK